MSCPKCVLATNVLKLLRASCFATLLVVGALINAQANEHTKRQIVNEQGEGQWWIRLNEGVVLATDARDEPPRRAFRAPENLTDFRGWHKPQVRKLVRELEREYGVTAISMTSYGLSTFTAHVPDQTLERVRADPRVYLIKPVWEPSPDYSIPWADYTSGGELVPWGKQAVGADDGYTAATPVYVMDGGMYGHSDLNIITSAPIFTTGAFRDHATHVAGIIGAYMNTGGVRGVNDGGGVINVDKGSSSYPDYMAVMDWVLGDAEDQNMFPIVNISGNNNGFCNDDLDEYMRRMSARLLVVQSAGNTNAQAWNMAYCRTHEADGILVVGGLDKSENRPSSYDNSHLCPPPPASCPNAFPDGSGYGTWVEVWAPSVDVYSTWGLSGTEKLSGTSMAAPHVAALAARYGFNTTRPVQREAFIRSILVSTGNSDPDSVLMRIPRYTQTPAFTPPSVLTFSATGCGGLHGSGANYVNDGLYTDNNMWNAGHGTIAAGGSHDPEIELDLGFNRAVQSLRLTPAMSPDGSTTHVIYAGTSPNPQTQVATVTDARGTNMATIPVSFTPTTARYIRIKTTSSPSWVAWKELEVYGF